MTSQTTTNPISYCSCSTNSPCNRFLYNSGPHDWVFYKWVREYWRWYMKSNWVHRLTMQSHKFQFLRPSRSLFLYSSFPYFNSIQHKRIITTYKIFPMYKPNDWWFINPTKTANILYQQWNSDKNKHKIYMEKLFSEKEPMRIFF